MIMEQEERRSRKADEQSRQEEVELVGLRRGSRITVRVLSVLGLITFSFMPVFVVSDAAGRVGTEQILEPPGSREARIGAERPGEAVHLTGTLAALLIGGTGRLGLAIRPERAGFAYQTAGVAAAMLIEDFIIGDPDNYGGQAGPVDVAFLIMALPPLAAAASARPWHTWRVNRLKRPRNLALAALSLPVVWYGIHQTLMQRNTWPPLADPHHQAHWYAMAVLAFMVTPVVGSAALSGRGWRLAAMTVGLAAIAVAAASFLAPQAASVLHPGWALVALVWGLAVMALTWDEARRV
jgi:hypothetical protein